VVLGFRERVRVSELGDAVLGFVSVTLLAQETKSCRSAHAFSLPPRLCAHHVVAWHGGRWLDRNYETCDVAPITHLPRKHKATVFRV
jgi:hypothetical protein